MKRCAQCGLTFFSKRKEQVYCSRSCASVKKGKLSSQWMKRRINKYRGARQIDKDGYARICGTGHPYRDGRLMIQEHIIIIERAIGRRLKKHECVHHINGNRLDNRLENLKLMSKSMHSSIHAKRIVIAKKRDCLGRFVNA
jgi:hypothetical protein